MQIEVPYNYDSLLLTELQPYKEYIIFLYMNAFPEDCIHARQGLIPEMSREVWEHHVHMIIEAGYPLAILLQTLETLPENILKYYITLGIKIFVVSNDENARQLKELGAQIIIGSITKCNSIYNLSTYDEVYDYIIAPFALNRNIHFLNTLPNKEKIVLLVNSVCSMHCEFFKWHWQNSEGIGKPCPYKNLTDPSYVAPKDLSLFQNKIAHIKLQGREWDTASIIKDVHAYSNQVNEGQIPYEMLIPFGIEDKTTYYHMEV